MKLPLSQGGNLCLFLLLLTIITDGCINGMQYNLKTLQNKDQKTTGRDCAAGTFGVVAEPWAC